MSQYQYIIREAKPNEFSEIGALMVNVYSELIGFPSPEEQPKYYDVLANIGEITKNPKVRLLVAESEKQSIDATVVYFGDMKYYGSGGIAPKETNTAGFRLLAVSQNARGKGLGRLLSQFCIDLARKQKLSQVIIHSTKTMQIAWKMYEKLGFKRSEDLDFNQDKLHVFGFRLHL